MVINLSRCLTLSVSVVALSAIPVSAAYLNYDTRLYNASMIDANTHTLKSGAQSSALSSSPMAFNLRWLSIAPSGSNLSTSNFPLTTSLFSSPMALNLRGLSIAPSGSNLSTSNFPQTASVCFITDTSDCGGIGAAGGEDNSGGGGSGLPDYEVDNEKKCQKEGYTKITCNSVEVPVNKCPYDETYIEKCVCKPTLISCSYPNVGVGEACGGKFESCCNNACSSGYDLSNGVCRQASALKTACGNACYKILSNNCSTGSLNPPAETDGNRNKVVATTECGNSCWQSFSDNCPTGYVKDKSGGKCYETSVSYTPYGSACYKEKPCCDNSCSGYLQANAPTISQCPYGSSKTNNGCGNICYTCNPCVPSCNNGNSEARCNCRYVYNDCGGTCTICEGGSHNRTFIMPEEVLAEGWGGDGHIILKNVNKTMTMGYGHIWYFYSDKPIRVVWEDSYNSGSGGFSRGLQAKYGGNKAWSESDNYGKGYSYQMPNKYVSRVQFWEPDICNNSNVVPLRAIVEYK